MCFYFTVSTHPRANFEDWITGISSNCNVRGQDPIDERQTAVQPSHQQHVIQRQHSMPCSRSSPSVDVHSSSATPPAGRMVQAMVEESGQYVALQSPEGGLNANANNNSANVICESAAERLAYRENEEMAREAENQFRSVGPASTEGQILFQNGRFVVCSSRELPA